MEEYKLNDKVKASPLYLANYAEWKVKDQQATIKTIKKIMVKADDLGKDDKALFQSKYEVQKEYTLYELGIAFDGDDKVYLVSQFGVSQ